MCRSISNNPERAASPGRSWTVSEPLYGYRQGLSQQELDLLIRHHDKVKKLLVGGPVAVTTPMTVSFLSFSLTKRHKGKVKELLVGGPVGGRHGWPD